MKYKKLHIMETKYTFHLPMCPNGLYTSSIKKIYNEVLKKAHVVIRGSRP